MASTIIDAITTLDLHSTGTASGSVATIDQAANVTAGTMNQTSGNKVNVGKNVVVDVVGNYHLNADGNCTIVASATIHRQLDVGQLSAVVTTSLDWQSVGPFGAGLFSGRGVCRRRVFTDGMEYST